MFLLYVVCAMVKAYILFFILVSTVYGSNSKVKIGVFIDDETPPDLPRKFPNLDLLPIPLSNTNNIKDNITSKGLQLLIGPTDCRDCDIIQQISVRTALPVLYTASCPSSITGLQLRIDNGLLGDVLSYTTEFLRWNNVGIITDDLNSVDGIIQSLSVWNSLLDVWQGRNFTLGLQNFIKFHPLQLIVAIQPKQINYFLKSLSNFPKKTHMSLIFTTILPKRSIKMYDWDLVDQDLHKVFILSDPHKLQFDDVTLEALMVANYTSSYLKHAPTTDWYTTYHYIQSYQNLNIDQGRIILRNGKRYYNALKLKELTITNNEYNFMDVLTWTPETLKSRSKREISGKSLTVTTLLHAPFMNLRADSDNFDGNEKYEGFLKDLLDMLADKLSFTYYISIVRDGKFGSFDSSTGRWSGMIRELVDGNAQIAGAAITKTANRQRIIDFTTTFMATGISVVFQDRSTLPPKFDLHGAVYAPFHFDMWLCLLATWIFTSLALYLIGWIYSTEDTEGLTPQECLWYTLSFIFFRQERRAKSASVRGLIILWCWFSILILAFYCSLLVSIHTESKSRNNLRTVEDLLGSGMDFGHIKSGSTEVFFKNTKNAAYKKMANVMKNKPENLVKSGKEGYGRVLNDSNYAFITETTDAEYMMSQSCNLAMLPSRLHKRTYGLALQKNSPYTSEISAGILHLEETGAISSLYEKWWSERSKCSPTNVQVRQSLSVYSIGGVFVLFTIGVIICVIISVGERFYYQRLNTDIKEKPESEEEPTPEKKTSKVKDEKTSDLGKAFQKLKEMESESKENLAEV